MFNWIVYDTLEYLKLLNSVDLYLQIRLYSHIKHKRYTYAKNTGRLKYTGDSVVQVRTFINFLTSEFGSTTRGERDTILNHSIQTKLKRSAHLILFKTSVGRDLQNSMVRLQLLNTLVLTQLQLSTLPKSTPNWTGSNRVLNWSGLQ